MDKTTAQVPGFDPDMGSASMERSPKKLMVRPDKMQPERAPRKLKNLGAEEEAKNRKMVRGYKAGGSVGSASKRADGCAQRGKTKGKMV